MFKLLDGDDLAVHPSGADGINASVEAFRMKAVSARELLGTILAVPDAARRADALLSLVEEIPQTILQNASRISKKISDKAQLKNIMVRAAKAFPQGVFYHLDYTYAKDEIAADMFLAATELSPVTALSYAAMYWDNPKAKEIFRKALQLEFAKKGDEVLRDIGVRQNPIPRTECVALCEEWRREAVIRRDTSGAAQSVMAQ